MLNNERCSRNRRPVRYKSWNGQMAIRYNGIIFSRLVLTQSVLKPAKFPRSEASIP